MNPHWEALLHHLSENATCHLKNPTFNIQLTSVSLLPHTSHRTISLLTFKHHHCPPSLPFLLQSPPPNHILRRRPMLRNPLSLGSHSRSETCVCYVCVLLGHQVVFVLFLVNICIRVGPNMTCLCLFFCHVICNVTHNSLFSHVIMPNHHSQSTNGQT